MEKSSLKEYLLPRVIVLDLSHQLNILDCVLEKSKTYVNIDVLTLLQQVITAISFQQRALLELDYLIFEIFSDGFASSICTETNEIRKMANFVGKKLYGKLEDNSLYIDGYMPYCVDKVVGTKVVLSLNDVWMDFYGKVLSSGPRK